MGKLSSFLNDLGTSYLKSEMGIDENSTEHKIEKQKYCPNCGNSIESDSEVCYKCGVNPQNVKHKKFCPYCGKAVNEEQVICLNCRESIENTVIDNANGGIKIICFLIPIIGLILYLSNINTRKEYATDCGSSALCGFIIGLLLFGVSLIVIFD